jgi:DNA-binding GntR family transcriptional regulator
VLEALKGGDPGIAGDAMRDHIEKVRMRSRSDSHLS